jgi:lycopene beta-cyclase
MSDANFDVIFAGGGLAATLAAYRLRQLRPNLRLLVLEAGDRLGGNHTWSFHDSDIGPAAKAWIAPFIAQSWPRQSVRFPKYSRTLSVGYNTVSSERLHDAAWTLLKDAAVLSAKVQEVTKDGVTLADGRAYQARCVIDARGQKPGHGLTVAYQKFVGLEVRLQKPHGQQFPVIMDAAVPQRDGYRFVYTLPFSADRMLIEDTYYSDTPLIDLPRLREGCLSYGKNQGWRIAEVAREEQGVLPVVLSGDIEAALAKNTSDVPVLGVRAGFFHHTTSYSFPFAVRCADAIAVIDPLTSEKLAPLTRAWQRQHWRDQRFFRLLNRMLFWAAKPERRYRVLERFYEMREPLIERFYSSSLTLADQARILAGWPPVPLGKALRVLAETRTNPLARAASSPR